MKLHEIQESFKDTIADPAALNGHNSQRCHPAQAYALKTG